MYAKSGPINTSTYLRMSDSSQFQLVPRLDELSQTRAELSQQIFSVVTSLFQKWPKNVDNSSNIKLLDGTLDDYEINN